MSPRYQVIARKYRPQSFKEVVGQAPAVTTLKNAIRFDKVAHAYLFCGSRGVGKTTLARLFAKALNCQAPDADFEPCNQCPSCLEIASGQSLDVIEIDGASNRGIDDIRQINETVGYAPSHGKYKIYIIDEVHMLTKEAFNALLKTLEEPPEKAKFFFATTESHKVLPTIISRCQRFDLARIQPSLISSKLQQITADLHREAEPAALQLIASFADGSLRDAESLLDQILCFAEGPITAAIVRQSLGLVPEDLFIALDQAFSECRLSFAFELVDQLFKAGKDLAHFLEQLIEHYRNLALCRTQARTQDDASDRYAASARLYTQAQCLYILDLLIQAESQFQKSTFQRISLESILLQIIRSKNRIPPEVLVKRLLQLEERAANNIAEPVTIKEESLPQEKQPLLKTEPLPTLPQISEPAQPIHSELPSLPLSLNLPQESSIQEETLQLKPVPFNPFKTVEQQNPEKPKVESPTPLPASTSSAIPSLPKTLEQPPIEKKKIESPSTVATSTLPSPSYRYDTIMRFAAIELEGTLKLN